MIKFLSFLAIFTLATGAPKAQESRLHREPEVFSGRSLFEGTSWISDTVKRALEGGFLRGVDTGDDVSRLDLIPGKNQVVTFGSHKKMAQIWSLPDLKPVSSVQLQVFPAPGELAVQFDQDQMTVSNFGHCQTLDLKTARSLTQTQAPLPQEVREPKSGVSAITLDSKVVVRDREGQTLAEFPNPQKSARQLCLNAQGTLIAIAHDHGRQRGGTVEVLEVASRSLVVRLEYASATFTQLRFSPTGSYFVAGAHNGRILVWDLLAQKLRFSCQAGLRLRSVELSCDGGLMLSAGSNQQAKGFVALWDAAAGRPVFFFELPQVVADATFVEDQAILFGSWSGTLGIFEYRRFFDRHSPKGPSKSSES